MCETQLSFEAACRKPIQPLFITKALYFSEPLRHILSSFSGFVPCLGPKMARICLEPISGQNPKQQFSCLPPPPPPYQHHGHLPGIIGQQTTES